jgi:sialic acid synthase SpsE
MNIDIQAFKKRLLKESEGMDHEVSMAQNSLKSIISAASELVNLLGQDEKDIPAWIQDHIANAENYINQAAKNYHEYSQEGNDDEQYDNM